MYRPLSRSLASRRFNLHRVATVSARSYAVEASSRPDRFANKHPNYVNIVEVGPRDGLQNEKSVIPAEVKMMLIDRLGQAGMKSIEAGSFVNPKWVPQVCSHCSHKAQQLSGHNAQMADTAEIIQKLQPLPGVHYPVLIPNLKGLQTLLGVLRERESKQPNTPPPTDEIAVFTAATDAFCQNNTNCTVKESLERIEKVVNVARPVGLRVRGYVSVVITCPYSGKVKPEEVKAVTKELLDIGCYEVSLGDTTGTGTPTTVRTMLETVMAGLPTNRLAGHFHDTFGTAVANVMTALDMGIRTIDSSVSGLGGCPYSPGATGNVATEDVMYALQDSKYNYPGNLDDMVDVGAWISEKLGRRNASRAATAILARRQRQKELEQKETEQKQR
ncbi:hypothetical protein NM688_g9250 [Phlebia brevispora]|uniref:Uncharacterized protein n=1 Tax=Phlebia brevispora TaxID=194682 RepID=A0ACC1RJL8_9APHY|nr:hypothetical protein NM688_g9250 [Phlebia brevispora]